MTTVIRVAQHHGGIRKIALKSPALGNTLSAEMATDVAAALAGPDPETRAVLFARDGADFWAGRRATKPPPGARKTAIGLKARIADPVLDFYEEAQLDAEVERIVAQLSKNTPPMVRGIKSCLNTSLEMSFTDRKVHSGLIDAIGTGEKFR